MAHEVYEIDDEYSMAFVGDTPWHGLGQQLDPAAPLEVWAKKAHLDWQVKSSTVRFNAEMSVKDRIKSIFDKKRLTEISTRKVLYRSDNQEPLGIVSDQYKPVQPIEVLEFFRDLIKDHGFKMHTAGSLQNGKRVWALADTGGDFRVMGQDQLRAFLLLATSYNKSLATTAMTTSIRVVCNNTLEFAYMDNKGGVKIDHTQKFDPHAVKLELGVLGKSWQQFTYDANLLAHRPVSEQAAITFFMNLFHDPKLVDDQKLPDYSDVPKKTVERLLKVYQGGVGQDLKSTNNTAWGLVNAVSRYYDHERPARADGNRLNSAWFGDGANIKNKAWDMAKAA